MSDQTQGGGAPARHPRTWVIEPLEHVDEETQEVTLFPDNEGLQDLVGKMLGTLDAVGGVLNIAADRVKTGEAGGQPLGATVGYIVQWHGHSPLRDLSDFTGSADAPAGDGDRPAE